MEQKLNYEHMANVFHDTGMWFMQLPKESEIDMGECRWTCGSPACVGGWLYKKYECQIGNNRLLGQDFEIGANAFARDLGFEENPKNVFRNIYYELSTWAYINKDLWGRGWNWSLFAEEEAYSEGDGEVITKTNITPQHVGRKFIAVAERIRAKYNIKEKGYLVLSDLIPAQKVNNK